MSKQIDAKENIKELVLRMAKRDRIVYTDLEGFTSVDLDKWLDSQPIEGVLYDLNRLGEVALTFMEKDIKWVNDFAVGLVIERLSQRCNEKDKLISEGREIVEAHVTDLTAAARLLEIEDMLPNTMRELRVAVKELNAWLKAGSDGN